MNFFYEFNPSSRSNSHTYSRSVSLLSSNSSNSLESLSKKVIQKDSLIDLSKRLFNNELSDDVTVPRDVKFWVGNEKMIEAHKFLLALRSPVFNSMFYGGLHEPDDCIKIPDIKPIGFENLLRYIYTDEFIEDFEQFAFTYQAADKYLVTSLCSKLIEFVNGIVSPNNAIIIYDQYISLNILQNAEKLDVEKLIEIINLNSYPVLNSDCFIKISLNSIISLLENDSLLIDEIDLFSACVRWLRNKLITEKKQLNPVNERELFNSFKHLIRFPIMSRKEFFGSSELEIYEDKIINEYEVIVPAKTDLFTSEELEEFEKYFQTNDPKVLSIHYKSIKRGDNLNLVRLDYDWKTQSFVMFKSDEQGIELDGDIVYKDDNGRYTDNLIETGLSASRGDFAYFKNGRFTDDRLKQLRNTLVDHEANQKNVDSTDLDLSLSSIKSSNERQVYLYKVQQCGGDESYMENLRFNITSACNDETNINYRKNNITYSCINPIIRLFKHKIYEFYSSSYWERSFRPFEFVIDQIVDKDATHRCDHPGLIGNIVIQLESIKMKKEKAKYTSVRTEEEGSIKILLKRETKQIDETMKTRSASKKLSSANTSVASPNLSRITRSSKKQQVESSSEKSAKTKRPIKQKSNSKKKIKNENNSLSEIDTTAENFNVTLPDSADDENSPSKLNSRIELINKSNELDFSDNWILTKKDDNNDYKPSQLEVLEDLPEKCDYSDVNLADDVFIGYEEERSSLHYLINNAIQRGESNTVLIYGRPGAGKTSFVNQCLKESESASYCRILKLSGIIHGNDVSTVHQIAKFLDIKFTDLPRLMDKFKEECRTKMANLIIVLDEFEVFCDKNQFLLYNFFDLIQYVNHILIIGITSRYDSIELLEKRVKSRMNHKIIDLKPPFKTLKEFLDFAKKLLTKDIKFTKDFLNNLDIQYSMSYSIAKLKMCLLRNLLSNNKSTRPAINQGPVKRCLEGIDDKVDLICKYLTNLEICILLSAAKLVYIKELDRFNCNILFESIASNNRFPSQFKSSNQKLLSMAVGVLIDYDLIAIEEKKSVQKQKLYLTEWTPLVLNVFKLQIDESLKRMEKRLPTDVALLFTI